MNTTTLKQTQRGNKVAELTEKYKDKIYTKGGNINLRTMKAIAIDAGLKQPVSIETSYYNSNYWIEGRMYDPYADAEDNKNAEDKKKEVKSIYNFCLQLKKSSR